MKYKGENIRFQQVEIRMCQHEQIFINLDLQSYNPEFPRYFI
jgi:hypothetical protein